MGHQPACRASLDGDGKTLPTPHWSWVSEHRDNWGCESKYTAPGVKQIVACLYPVAQNNSNKIMGRAEVVKSQEIDVFK